MHRHDNQRRFHLFRHGRDHLFQHLRSVRHDHLRREGPSRRLQRRRNQRLARIAGIAAGILGLVIIVAAGAALYRAQSSLSSAKAAIDRIDAHQNQLLNRQGRGKVRAELVAAASSASRSKEIIDGSSSLKLLSWLPVIGSQVHGAADLAGDVDTVAKRGVVLLDRADKVAAASTGTSIDLAALAGLQRSLDGTITTLLPLKRSASGLLWPVDSARNAFDERLSSLENQLGRASSILGYAQTFLGSDGPKTYLLATQNESEMRDQGSVLSVAELQAADGHLSVSSPRGVGELPLSSPVNVPTPPETVAVFSQDRPTSLWQNANVTANFPWSGSVYQAMYAQTTGRQVDGVVAIDVHALAGLLELSGPVNVPGIDVAVSADNVTTLLLHDLYSLYPRGDQQARKDLLSEVAKSTFDQLAKSKVDAAALAHTLANEVAGRHLLVYDANPANEATLRRYGASGAVDASMPSSTFHLAVENRTATKLDFYIRSFISQQVLVDGKGNASVLTQVTVSNLAPAGQSPSYQLGPDVESATQPGQYLGNVYLWSPRGSSVPYGQPESGLVVSSGTVDLMPGQSQTVRFVAYLPKAVKNGKVSLRWVPQPGVVAQDLSVRLDPREGSTLKPVKQRLSLSQTQILELG